jgi:hypothetical protein
MSQPSCATPGLVDTWGQTNVRSEFPRAAKSLAVSQIGNHRWGDDLSDTRSRLQVSDTLGVTGPFDLFSDLFL